MITILLGRGSCRHQHPDVPEQALGIIFWDFAIPHFSIKYSLSLYCNRYGFLGGLCTCIYHVQAMGVHVYWPSCLGIAPGSPGMPVCIVSYLLARVPHPLRQPCSIIPPHLYALTTGMYPCRAWWPAFYHIWSYPWRHSCTCMASVGVATDSVCSILPLEGNTSAIQYLCSSVHVTCTGF